MAPSPSSRGTLPNGRCEPCGIRWVSSRSSATSAETPSFSPTRSGRWHGINACQRGSAPSRSRPGSHDACPTRKRRSTRACNESLKGTYGDGSPVPATFDATGTLDLPAPLLNPWLPGFLRLNEEAAARGCRTILTGNGGDEWLATPILAADLIRTLRFRQLASFASDCRRSYGQSDWHIAKTIFWRFGLRTLLVDGTQPFLESRARPLLRRRLERQLPAWFAPDHALRRELFDRPTSPH